MQPNLTYLELYNRVLAYKGDDLKSYAELIDVLLGHSPKDVLFDVLDELREKNGVKEEVSHAD